MSFLDGYQKLDLNEKRELFHALNNLVAAGEKGTKVVRRIMHETKLGPEEMAGYLRDFLRRYQFRSGKAGGPSSDFLTRYPLPGRSWDLGCEGPSADPPSRWLGHVQPVPFLKRFLSRAYPFHFPIASPSRLDRFIEDFRLHYDESPYCELNVERPENCVWFSWNREKKTGGPFPQEALRSARTLASELDWPKEFGETELFAFVFNKKRLLDEKCEFKRSGFSLAEQEGERETELSRPGPSEQISRLGGPLGFSRGKYVKIGSIDPQKTQIID